MTAKPVRKVWLDKPTREALAEYAWANRTSAGDVIRAAVVDVRDNATNLNAMSDRDTPSQVQASVKVDEELWAAARRAAREVDLSINSAIRRRLIKLLTDEGFM